MAFWDPAIPAQYLNPGPRWGCVQWRDRQIRGKEFGERRGWGQEGAGTVLRLGRSTLGGRGESPSSGASLGSVVSKNKTGKLKKRGVGGTGGRLGRQWAAVWERGMGVAETAGPAHGLGAPGPARRARPVMSAVVTRNQFGAELPRRSDYVPHLSPPQRPRFTAQDFRQRGLERPCPATGQPPPAFTPAL